MSTNKTSKTVRQIKERAAEIRRQGMSSIPRSLDLAAREHGFRDFEHARTEITEHLAALKAAAPAYDLSLIRDRSIPTEPEPEPPTA